MKKFTLHVVMITIALCMASQSNLVYSLPTVINSEEFVQKVDHYTNPIKNVAPDLIVWVQKNLGAQHVIYQSIPTPENNKQIIK